MTQKQLVMIKGTKDGLALHLDDLCSYEMLLNELIEKLDESFQPQNNYQEVTVSIELGNRYLTKEQTEVLRDLIEKKNSLVVSEVNSNVMSVDDVEELIASSQVTTLLRTVRSGQVLEVAGDMLLIGDVNPGGSVIAGGNIYIMGTLKGNAHAGFSGNNNAVIAATIFEPMQIKISEQSLLNIDEVTKNEQQLMRCAYLSEDGTIVVGKIQMLPQIRRKLTSLKGEL